MREALEWQAACMKWQALHARQGACGGFQGSSWNTKEQLDRCVNAWRDMHVGA